MGAQTDTLMVEIEQVPSADSEEGTRQVQAVTEGVVDDRRVHVELDGERYSYNVANKVGLMPLLKFAHAADQGIDSQDIEGLNAIYEMLQDCIHENDWDRFKREMTKSKAFVDDLLPVVQQAISIISARPTGEPSGSSPSSSNTSDGSTENSSRGLVAVKDLAG